VSQCSHCGSPMPPRDQRLSPEAAAAREANRERRRKAYEESLGPPSPQEAREATRRLLMEAIGGLLPIRIPAVAAVAGVAVVVAGEAIPVALVATLAGTITGWFAAYVVSTIGEQMSYRGVVWHRDSLGLVVYEWVGGLLSYVAAVGVTLLVSRIL
jgi:hypothetical protein